MNSHSVPRLPAAIVVLFLGLAGCSGGSGSGGDGDGNGNPGVGPDAGDCLSGDDIECSLNALGVDTTITPRQVRIDEDTVEDLPEDYAPLGSSRTVSRFDELLLLGGLRLDGEPNAHALTRLIGQANNTFDEDPLFLPDAGDTPWTDTDFIHAATAGDTNGDGRDEMLVVYQDASLAQPPTYLVIIDDAEDGNTIGSPMIVSSDLVSEGMAIVAADFSGDGLAEVAVGIVTSTGASVVFLDNDQGDLSVSPLAPLTFEPSQFGGPFTIDFAAGNLDFDRAVELGIVTNEYEGSLNFNNNDGLSHYRILDDANADFAELASARVDVPTSSGTESAAGSDLAMGDVDGDGLDEVVIGGLTAVGNECNLDADYVVMVLDDKPREFAVLRTVARPHDTVSGACESGASRKLTYTHVNTPDLAGDGLAEIQVNNFVFEDFAQSTSADELTLGWTIPGSQYFWPGTSSSDGVHAWHRTYTTVGDVTSDERDNIVYFARDDGRNSGVFRGVRVWGIDQIDGWEEMHSIAVDFQSATTGSRPQVVLANVNNDSTALKYSEGSYRLLFTEPIIIAALAAAPCSEDLGQEIGDCRTAFGKGSSNSVSTETGWSLTAGRSVGFEAEFSVLGVKVGGVEAVATIEAELRSFRDETYTVSKRVVHTTGPIEDSVIFTTIPMDVYTYQITSHPDPELVGSEVQLRLPREPISIMTERGFYNESIPDDGFPIDDAVFQHTAGQPLTYPTTSQRNSLLSQYEGLQTDEVDVGQGNGFVTAELNVFEEVTQGESYSLSTKLDIKATASGVINGISIGGGVDSSIAYSRGKESIYQGSVAQMPADSFATDAYRFGLFSYVFEEQGEPQTFEVVNYWVRPQL